LWIVATPIGNLEDVTLRALRVLREADVIAAEDTRRTRILLQHHGIDRPLTSYYDAVERAKAPRLVAQMVAGKRIALVSDAGTPGIADPGYHLVRAAVAAGIPVVPIPGASSVAALVSVSGLAVDRFAFEGFLPARSAARGQRLAELATERRAMVFLEAGRRLTAFLEAARDAFGDRDAVIGRELTKRHEETMRGTLATLAAAAAARESILGEVTIVVAGAAEAPPAAGDLDDEIRKAHEAGLRLRELSADVARRTGRSRRDVYQRALAILGKAE
jgi:16S rRNA (cytidine1402-2'-O)-methyltransferase